MQRYSFPEKNVFKAKDLLQPMFDIQTYWDSLYVNLDSVRQQERFEEILFQLNISDDQLLPENVLTTPLKMLFSGHQGSGKTAELYRLYRQLDHHSRYFVLYVELEKESDLYDFRIEDFFFLVVSKLLQQLNAYGVACNIETDRLLNAICDTLTQNTEVKIDDKRNRSLEARTEIELDSSKGFLAFLSWLSLKGGTKGVLSTANETVKTIRYNIETNWAKLIEQFNKAMEGIRFSVRQANRGNDVLLIFDGSEKIRYETYERIFSQDSHLIRSLQLSLICSVPIHSFYRISGAPASQYFDTYVLPMVRINEKSEALLRQIITRRIDEAVFFAEGVLDYCVEQSGGCIRQLLNIVGTAFVIAAGKRIQQSHAEKSCKRLGQELFERLDSEHLLRLRQHQYNNADPKVQEMLYALALLKYNGDRSDKQINPLLKPFLNL